MISYKVVYNAITGQVIGVQGDTGGVIPPDTNNADFRAFLVWNAQQPVPLSLADVAPTARVRRQLYAIYTDLQALTTSQKTAVWLNLSAGNPKKYLLDAGPNAGSIGTLDYLLNQTTITWSAADSLALKMRLTMNYVQDNPQYLVNPAFDPTINVPGDQLP